ncbi:hypothetical protein JHK82_037949 [Glycine max]|nr:hypothetical protein JHK82_037949 [Glycine max]KAG5131965.1 hypothetical protein JHK84_038362 [Glycine max]
MVEAKQQKPPSDIKTTTGNQNQNHRQKVFVEGLLFVVGIDVGGTPKKGCGKIGLGGQEDPPRALHHHMRARQRHHGAHPRQPALYGQRRPLPRKADQPQGLRRGRGSSRLRV